jgi:predicted kinase
MKNIIKRLLRENVGLNSLGVAISRPDQELIIMRGIPGSGKSTKAKELVGEGIIHSTDDVISSTGDYNKFFSDMIASGNFSRLSDSHKKNLENAITSMESGVTPVIIDNTNIRPFEPKAYVQKALELGYDDNNIKIVDVGTGGVLAEELAQRNTHGVPLDKIKSMIDSHKSFSPLTIDKILQAENTNKPKKVLYSAVVIDDVSRNMLLREFGSIIPDDWKIFAHHMTITFGKGVEDESELGKEVGLVVTEIGKSDMAIAVMVEGYPSSNKIPHITLAVNPDGGKPFMSNQITDWEKSSRLKIRGTVTNITA